MNAPLVSTPGLLWGFAVQGGRGAHVTNETAAEAFALPHDWSWMHFALADHRARRFLQSFAPVPEPARELLLSQETRLQIHLAPDCAYGVLPDIEKDFEGQTLGAGRLAFFLDARHLVTVRHHPLRAVDELREAVETGLVLAAPSDAFVRLVEHFIAIVEDRLLRLTQQLDHIEDVVLSDRDDIDPAGLGPIRRELSRYRREFLGLRGALARAVQGRGGQPAPDCPIAPHLPGLAQAAEDFERDAAALADRARLLYEEMDTRIAARTNRSLSTLTVLSTLLLPPTFVAGAFGMNLNGIPWAQDANGFWWAIGLCGAVVAAAYVLLRRFRIL
ncbi:MAG: CorA family divalent cation transporter [Rhizomicrobium sp.]